MRELKKLDKVAYIRFASVYRNFGDVDAFSRAIREVSQKVAETGRGRGFFPPPTTLHGRSPAPGRTGLDHHHQPNPRVGCVLVRTAPWSARAGTTGPASPCRTPGAAGGRRRRPGATAYVTLGTLQPPRPHPPCADALIAAGVVRVVAAMADPNPLVAGGASTKLRRARVETACGLLENEARELNIGFVSRMTRGGPGCASGGGQSGRQDGPQQQGQPVDHRPRGPPRRPSLAGRACAILTGIGTVRDDDPQLTVREVETTRQPLRVVVDSKLETPLTARLLQGGNVPVAGAVDDRVRIAALGAAGAEVFVQPNAGGKGGPRRPDGRTGPARHQRSYAEAGCKLNGSLLRGGGLVDELLLYLAPCLIGDDAQGLFNLAAPDQPRRSAAIGDPRPAPDRRRHPVLARLG